MMNNRGVSLVELMVGLGVMAMIAFMAFGSINLVRKQATDMQKALESGIDQSVGERIIMNDLRFSGISYNNLTVVDDQNRAFYDFIDDLPSLNLTPEENRRVLTLAGPEKYFYVLTQSLTGSAMLYDPPLAYEIGAAPSDINQPAALTFVSLNNKNAVSSRAPNMWRDGNMIMLDTAAALRPVIGGSVDMTKPPRTPIFVGEVRGQALEQNSILSSIVRQANPMTSIDFHSADEFLRLLPSNGGGLPLVRIRGIQVRRYSLQAKPGTTAVKGERQPMQLVRHSLKLKGWEEPFVVADDVQQVIFERKSLNQRLVYFRIQRPKPQ